MITNLVQPEVKRLKETVNFFLKDGMPKKQIPSLLNAVYGGDTWSTDISGMLRKYNALDENILDELLLESDVTIEKKGKLISLTIRYTEDLYFLITDIIPPYLTEIPKVTTNIRLVDSKTTERYGDDCYLSSVVVTETDVKIVLNLMAKDVYVLEDRWDDNFIILDNELLSATNVSETLVSIETTNEEWLWILIEKHLNDLFPNINPTTLHNELFFRLGAINEKTLVYKRDPVYIAKVKSMTVEKTHYQELLNEIKGKE